MNLVPLLINILATAIAAEPAIPQSIKAIITALASSVSAVFASGVTSGVNPQTVLTALSGVVAALKATTNLSPTTLSLIASIDKAIGEALQADSAAQQQITPSTLHQESTI